MFSEWTASTMRRDRGFNPQCLGNFYFVGYGTECGFARFPRQPGFSLGEFCVSNGEEDLRGCALRVARCSWRASSGPFTTARYPGGDPHQDARCNPRPNLPNSLRIPTAPLSTVPAMVPTAN